MVTIKYWSNLNIKQKHPQKNRNSKSDFLGSILTLGDDVQE